MGAQKTERPESSAEDTFRRELQTAVNKKYVEYYWGCMGWSVRYHLCLFGSVIASIFSASWLKLDFFKNTPYQSDYAVMWAITAAALAAVMGAGRFDEKWRANRLSRSLTEQLKLELLKPGANVTDIHTELKGIIKQHDEAIIGRK